MDSVAAWQQLSALYEHAEPLEGVERSRWLGQLRAEGHPLLAQLERMLEAREHIDKDDFLQALPVFEGAAERLPSEWGEGSRVGPYRLVSHIGSGGMAEVWLAERADGAFERRVAIKLLFNHPTRAERESFVERFRRERDILASLHHRHIAALHDAGVLADGQPWLALEYVAGESITSWCDRRRLDVEARIRLFVQVIHAVEYSHANLVVHRDLKPANIFVTEGGEVRLLDFGIAKLQDAAGDALAETALTRHAGRPLTLRYASPEQVLGRPLSTACDIYSLGVVLHELLCGAHPHESALSSAAALLHDIEHVEPRLPSSGKTLAEAASARRTTPAALRKTLAADLDAVLLKALMKSPQARYDSASALRADLERWLADEPVLARRPSAAYRAAKFFVRHRVLVTTGGVLASGLLAASVVAIVLGLRAEQQAERALAARDFLLSTYRMADRDEFAGADVTVQDALATAVVRAERELAGQPQLMADVLRGVAEVQDFRSELTAAADTWTRTVAAYGRLGDKRNHLLARIDEADVRRRANELPRAAVLLRVAGEEAAAFASDHELQARLRRVQGWLAYSEGRLAAAEQFLGEGLAHSSKAWGSGSAEAVEALVGYARVQSELGKSESARARMAEAMAAAPNARLSARNVSQMAIEQAIIEAVSGRYRSAESLIDAARVACERDVGGHSETCAKARTFQASLANRSRNAISASRVFDALRNDALRSEASQERAQQVVVAVRLAVLLNRFEKEDPLRVRLREFAQPASPGPMMSRQEFNAGVALAEVALYDADLDAAQVLLADLSRSPRRRGTEDGREIARMHVVTASLFYRQGRPTMAVDEVRRAQTAVDALLGREHPLSVLTGLNAVAPLAQLGETSLALETIDRALPLLTESFGVDSALIQRIVALRVAVATVPAAGIVGDRHVAEIF